MRMAETILEPDLPIVDPHHHLWDRRNLAAPAGPQHPFNIPLADARRYLLDELIADTGSGHNIVATVFLQCTTFYREGGPAEMRPVGEVEFVNGVAAMSASGVYGPMRACAGIVGWADLRLGDRVTPVLEALVRAGGDRFRGVRNSAAYDDDPEVLGPSLNHAPAELYRDAKFREGFKRLAPLGLSFDAWLLEPQLPDLIDLARAFPETTIVLDHVGTPLGLGRYRGRREERFSVWRDSIRELARCPNAAIKLGGMGMAFCGFPSFLARPAASSEQLAREWAPYVETCIEAFGAERCMFESNFPVDRGGCDYATLWNAFKRLAGAASANEKAALFAGAAKRIYRLSL
jgi:predicted TIM-barrel fold metal-dependent hydrolase